MSTTEVNRDDEIIAQVLATYTTPVSKIKCKVYLNEPFKPRSFSDFLPASAGKKAGTQRTGELLVVVTLLLQQLSKHNFSFQRVCLNTIFP